MVLALDGHVVTQLECGMMHTIVRSQADIDTELLLLFIIINDYDPIVSTRFIVGCRLSVVGC